MTPTEDKSAAYSGLGLEGRSRHIFGPFMDRETKFVGRVAAAGIFVLNVDSVQASCEKWNHN